MTLIQSILLGILQGATEFLPVSSSGHLLVLRSIMGVGDVPVLFDILMHIPTLIAIVLVFRRRIAALLISLWRFARRASTAEDQPNLRLVVLILLASLSTAVVGLAVAKLQDYVVFTTRAVGVCFVITALVLIASRFLKARTENPLPGFKVGFITGLAQGLGVLPGISRSGITISAALASGLERKAAGEFAFLISIPAIVGALALKIADFESMPVSPVSLLAGMAAAFAVGLVSLMLLLRLVRQGRLFLFGFYLLPVGIAAIVLG